MPRLAPYSGSLLRLALTTTAIMALVAAMFAFWQESHQGARTASSSVELSP